MATYTPIFIIATNWNTKNTTVEFDPKALEAEMKSTSGATSLKGTHVSFIYIIGGQMMSVFLSLENVLDITRGDKSINLVRDLIHSTEKDGRHTLKSGYCYLNQEHIYGLFLEELKINFNIINTTTFDNIVLLNDAAYREYLGHSGSGYFGHRTDLCVLEQDPEIELLWEPNRTEQ